MTDIPPEYMHCFNINDDIPMSEATENIEESQIGLSDIVQYEWRHHWENNAQNENNISKEQPPLLRIMDLDSYNESRNKPEQQQSNISSRAAKTLTEAKKLNDENTTKREAVKRGHYRSYTALQIQELLDLVIERGLSARRAGFIVGIVERTAQHYVKQYKDDVQKRLPGRKPRIVGNNRKLESSHTSFLIDFYEKNSTAVLWEAQKALLEAFPELQSITFVVFV